jgi:hypothetical protein
MQVTKEVPVEVYVPEVFREEVFKVVQSERVVEKVGVHHTCHETSYSCMYTCTHIYAFKYDGVLHIWCSQWRTHHELV